jgi:hydroxylaminobenzene mutase
VPRRAQILPPEEIAMAANLGALLCQRGVLLFLLGLLTGSGQGIYRNPRVGLSAHMTGVQSGTALIAFGLLWPHLGVAPGWAAPAAYMLWLSFYAIWLALVLAAFFGASKVLPIAGQGFTAKPWQEALVATIMIAGSVACIAGVGGILVLGHRQTIP